jgi:hypothetical protein
MARRLIVDDMVAEVRSLIDEVNVENIRDVEDILPALNRGQDYAASVLVRRYEEPLMVSTTLTLPTTTDEIDIPDDAFEGRIDKLEVLVGTDYFEVKRISFRDVTDYEYPLSTNVPQYYAVVGNKFRLLPKPSTAYPVRLWYPQDPSALELSQGQVRSLNVANNYIIVDAIGSGLTTNVDQLNSYVNFIDGSTGRVKKTMQIQSLSDQRITFKSTPTRTSVLGRTVSGSFTADDLQPDDYICTVHGTCVPFLKKPLSNFLINFAVADIKINKLGGEPGLLPQQMGAFEKQVERLWVGQEQTLRVKRVNSHFGTRRRRRFLWNP